MIYITGDTHAEFKHRFNMENFPEQKEMTKDDYVIICGDFGGVWDVGWESKTEKYWLDTIIRFFRYAPAPVQSARCSVA